MEFQVEIASGCAFLPDNRVGALRRALAAKTDEETENKGCLAGHRVAAVIVYAAFTTPSA